MTDSLKLAEMQRTSIEFERQRHLTNWFIKSGPHMATPSTPLSTNGGVSGSSSGAGNSTNNTSATQSGNGGTKNGSSSREGAAPPTGGGSGGGGGGAGGVGGGTITTTNPLFFLMSSNGNAGAVANASHPHSHPHPHHPNGIPVGKHGSGPEGVGHASSKVHPVIGAAPAVASPVAAAAALGGPHAHHVEGRKPKLRRFNSHDTGANMFSVADFENARLARRNEIEMKQRLQRRMKLSAGGGGSGVGLGGYASGCGSGYGSAGGLGGYGSLGGDCSTGDSKGSKHSNDSQTEPLPAEIFLDRYTLPRVVRISYKTKFSHETLQSSSSNGSTTTSTQSSSGTGTSSTSSSSGNVNGSNNSNNNNNHHHHNISNNNNNNNSGSQQSSSKHGSNSSPSTGKTTTVMTTTSTNGVDHQQQEQSGELFLLYRLVRQRHIYHGFNAKTGVANRKKGVMIPQEFPGYFSLLNEKGLPTATLYTSLIQLVRERVYKFVSVDNMPAFTESQPSGGAHHGTQAGTDGCLPMGGAGGGYHTTGPPPPLPSTQRPQYVKTTARGGQVFRLLAVFEDGKQDHSGVGSGGGAGMGGCTGGGGAAGSGVIGGGGVGGGSGSKQSSHGREKEKGRYAQLLNENRQVLYVSLSTKGKFYEIEPGIPQILQKLGGIGVGGVNDPHKKVNPDCVHRITALVTPHKELPMALRFISGPAGSSNSIPEQLTITKISTENVVIACPIEDVEVQSPLHLRKLHLTAEMNLVKCSLGFENEQRMFANPNVQNILKFCQFNCDQFLKMVEVEVLHRPERSGSKSRGDGLRILKPLHLPKLLRREKTTISAHEKEDSIIFLSKNDLANLEAKEEATRQSVQETGSMSTTNRISEKMKVFQTTKKKWFRRQDKHAVTSLTSLDLDVQAKRMSMERYNDMSKLLQERFGDKHNSNGGQTSNGGHTNGGQSNGHHSNGHHSNGHQSNGNHSNGHSTNCGEETASSERSTSEIGCSDTETTTLHTIEEKLKKFNKSSHSMQPLLQKSLSLQDVELIGGGKPDLLASHHTNKSNNTTADTISEAGTDLEDLENRPPSSIHQHPLDDQPQHQQQSFITEKLYTEFHVKTRQYSKSSSSLHQLLHFAAPQKIQTTTTGHESKRSLAQVKQQQQQQHQQQQMASKKPLDFNIGEPVTGRRAAGGLSQFAAAAHGGLGGGSLSTSAHSQNTSLISPLTPTSLIEDDLPYSSVRDSLVLSSDESASDQPTGQICQALHLIDYTKENIYAEICHDAVAMGGIPSSQTRETFSSNTQSTDIGDGYDDDYGDYASLTHPYMTVGGSGIPNTSTTTSNGFTGQAVSRVQINCSSSPVSYHTVFLGDEPLGAHYASASGGKRESSASTSRSQRSSVGGGGGGVGVVGDMANVTTVECYSGVTRGEAAGSSTDGNGSGSRARGGERGAAGVVVMGEGAGEEGVDNIYNTLK